MRLSLRILLGLLISIGVSCQQEAPPENIPQPPVTVDTSEIRRPNIIFLLTDDQRSDILSFAGNPIIQTPNLDKLAREGIFFENAFVSTSICSVSRASILSGQYGRRHQIWGFGKSFSQAQFAETYPMVLKNAGYTVGFIGKYGVGSTDLPASEFNYWKGFGGQGNYSQTDDSGNPIHLTKKIGQQIQEFLNLYQESDTPFCLSVSFKAPHVQDGARPDPEALFPFDPAYASYYEETVWQKPLAAAGPYFNHFPGTFTSKNEARKRWSVRFSTEERYDASLEGYYRLVHGVDVVVGELLDSLEQKGLADNTIVIFSSDNGFYLGEYGFAGKWYGSEPCIRVPMIIYDPRPDAPKGQRIQEISLNIDIAPTILSLAGAEIPAVMQGKNLMDLFNNVPNWRTDFLYEHIWPDGTPYYIPSTEGVVSLDRKYMQYFVGLEPTQVLFEELYLLGQDPFELKNLAQDSTHLQSRNQLIARLNDLKNQLQ